jgi:hypothetical protein
VQECEGVEKAATARSDNMAKRAFATKDTLFLGEEAMVAVSKNDGMGNFWK